jgi:hypothetical protein
MKDNFSEQVFEKLAIARWGEGEAAKAYAKEQHLDFLRYAVEFSFEDEQEGLADRLSETENEEQVFEIAEELQVSDEKMKEGAVKAMLVMMTSWGDFAKDEKIDNEIRDRIQQALEEIAKEFGHND